MDYTKPLNEQIKIAKDSYNPSDYVMEFLRLIADNSLNDKAKRDAKNKIIEEIWESGLEISDPTGTKKIGSKVLQQVMWRVRSKEKFNDVVIHGTGKEDNEERLVTEGVMTVADRGKLAENLTGKGGVFQNRDLKGDGFLMFGKGKNEKNPVYFRALRNEDVYPDTLAYGIRGVRPAQKLCVLFQFSKDEAYEMYPELKKNNIFGRIPGSFQANNKIEDREGQDVLELAWGYNIAKKCHIIFAGAQAYELERYEDEEYPFIKNDEPFIPVFQFFCQPSLSGFWNYGIGDMVADLAVVAAKLMNLEVSHISKNSNPITILNTSQSKADELVEKLAMAHEAEKQGGVPYVAMESDGTDKGVVATSLLTQNLFNEWSAVFDRIYRELSRLGINVDDIERGSGITRGQVIAEEQASNAFVQQMGEDNANEAEELIECIMDAITEFVSVKNKSSLNLLTTMMLDDGTQARIDIDVTMGMLSKTLKEGNWFAKADSRSGAILSELSQLVKEEGLIALTQPGSPENTQLFRSIAMRRGVNIKGGQPMQPVGGAQPGGSPAISQQPAETQRTIPAPTGNLQIPV